MGKINYYYGTMASGKSLKMLANMYQFNEQNEKILAMSTIKTVITSRAPLEAAYAIKIEHETDILSLVLNKYKDSTSIFIDEAEFLTLEQVKQIRTLTNEYDIDVYCYGLRTDFLGNLFEGSAALFAHADHIEELKSKCECGKKKSSYNMRLLGGKPVFAGNQKALDEEGGVTYKSVCPRCYTKYYQQWEKENNL